MATCVYCGAEKPDTEFYPNSYRKCRSCVNATNRERYKNLYSASLKQARREKDLRRKEDRQLRLSDVLAAYLAGIIDGEGSVRITQRGRDGGTGLRPGQYTLMVEVTNTHEGIIRWLHQMCGGSVSYAKADVKRNTKEKWHWRVAANRALGVLDAIYPHLIIKRPQAKLGRRFQRYVQVTGRKRTEKIHRLQAKFYESLRALNKRGLT